MALYDDRARMVQTMRTFLAERPEWQESCSDADGNPQLHPLAFFHFLAWAQYRGLLSEAEAMAWGEDMHERLAWLAVAHQRIDAMDHP